MKKFILKFISLLFCLVFSLSLFACNPNDEKVESEDKFDTYVDTVNKEEISDSSTLFISNGVSNYHILLSSNVDDNRKLVQEKASSEINFFLKDAGYPELPITYDNEIDGVDFNKKYISIGNTKYYQAYLEQNELKNDLDRVQVESLFVRYMELKNYSEKYSSSDLTLMVNEFERIANLGNLTQFNNGGKNGATQVKDFINSFR